MSRAHADEVNTRGPSGVAEEAFWSAARIAWAGRRVVLWVTGVAAVASVVISLLIPNWYRASTRLLLPEASGSGMASALLGDLGSAAKSLLGGGAGNYQRYLAILHSRSVLGAVVDSFNLATVYGVADGLTPHEDAMELLSSHMEITIDQEYNFLTVYVTDEDAERAAAMTNALTLLLDQVNNDLASATARRFRQYVQMRYDDATASREDLLDSLQAFQSKYGVFDLQAQTGAFFTQIAELRGRTVQAEIELEALRSRVGPDNTELAIMTDVVASANRKYQEALAGGESLLPVAQQSMPDVVRAYMDIEMNRTIQEKILQFVAPMLEQARFDEERQSQALQTVDLATPPMKKAGPRRSIICIVTTLSALLLSLLYLFAMVWWRERHAYLARRLRETTGRE